MIVLNNACPNCRGSIDDKLLLEGRVCSSCLPLDAEARDRISIAEMLRSSGRLRDYSVIARLEEETGKFREEFKKAVGGEPWPLQEIWARRVLLDESFSIVAPTGVGKTVFCLVMALYLIKHKDRRCYIILPSSLMVEQSFKRVSEFIDRLGMQGEIVAYYHSGLDKRTRREMIEKIESGDFKLLITTDRFLVTRAKALVDKRIDNIFVDDVDSFLKSPKNIDKAISLLGFREDIIDKVFTLVKLRKKLAAGGKEAEEEYRKILEEIDAEKRRAHGKLLVAGATVRAEQTKRTLLFRELLGFNVGVNPKFVRNIVDFRMKVEKDPASHVIDIVKRHGGGALVFVPLPLGRDYAKNLTDRLNSVGISAYFYEKMEEGILERFTAGEFMVLVGMASGRSPFARGIDLPETVRYAVFTGVPRREIRVQRYEVNPNKLHMLLTNILEILDENKKLEALKILQSMKKFVPVKRDVLEKISQAILEGGYTPPWLEYMVSTTKRAAEFVSTIMTDEFLRKIEESTDISVKRVEDELRITIPDVTGYLQASGRTSRLFGGGITRGVCILLEDDEKALRGLTSRLKFILEDFDWVEYSYDAAKAEFAKVDLDRQVVRQMKEGVLGPSAPITIREALMIVESPTKARTFARFFGKPLVRKIDGLTVYSIHTGDLVLNIVASLGHLTDLSLGPEYYGVVVSDGSFRAYFSPIRRCDKCGYQFVDEDRCPVCGSSEIFSKESVIEALRKVALTVNEVYVATDPDAEGEKIAYDLTCLLKPYNPNIFRLEFHEVTRKALMSALKNKHSYSENLVSAQLVRRIEDRWFGFELSRRLWEHFGSKNLSAGRVQTPVLGWIVKRAEEARKKKTLARVWLEGGVEFVFENPRNLEEIKRKFRSGELAVKIFDVEEVVSTLNPPPPYTTATLLQDAYSILRYPVALTMRLAQELFESGFITYHRTDSTTVSTAGLNLAREYIASKGLGEFIPRTFFREGAHECIRPVRPIDRSRLYQYLQIGLIKPAVEITNSHLRLYDLIFRRFIASQMEPAKIRTQRLKAELEGNILEPERIIRVIEDGFVRVFPSIRLERALDERHYHITGLKIVRVPAVPLYSEGDLISLMREKRIGRPSTYSRMIQVLFERNYVFEKNGRIIPTSRGVKVYEYLEKNFSNYISEETTRELEEIMDRIESGKEDYMNVLRRLKEQAEKIAQKTG